MPIHFVVRLLLAIILFIVGWHAAKRGYFYRLAPVFSMDAIILHSSAFWVHCLVLWQPLS